MEKPDRASSMPNERLEHTNFLEAIDTSALTEEQCRVRTHFIGHVLADRVPPEQHMPRDFSVEEIELHFVALDALFARGLQLPRELQPRRHKNVRDSLELFGMFHKGMTKEQIIRATSTNKRAYTRREDILYELAAFYYRAIQEPSDVPSNDTEPAPLPDPATLAQILRTSYVSQQGVDFALGRAGKDGVVTFERVAEDLGVTSQFVGQVITRAIRNVALTYGPNSLELRSVIDALKPKDSHIVKSILGHPLLPIIRVEQPDKDE